jgi:hypothetical protein
VFGFKIVYLFLFISNKGKPLKYHFFILILIICV